MRLPHPMPVSLSNANRVGTAPACWMRDHTPPSRSGVVRDGSMRDWKKPEQVEVITNTGGAANWLSPNGKSSWGNHRSHWAWKPCRVHKPVSWIRDRVIRADPRTFRPKQRLRPRPSHIVRNSRRRHPRKSRQQHPNFRFENVKARARRRPSKHRSSILCQRPIDGPSRDSDQPCNISLRILTDKKQVAYLCFIVQFHHLP